VGGGRGCARRSRAASGARQRARRGRRRSSRQLWPDRADRLLDAGSGGSAVASAARRHHGRGRVLWPRPRASAWAVPHGAEGGGAREGGLSLGVGLVPCTGAVLILLYAMANDILFAGVVLVVAIAAGMAITMGALGVLSIVARNAVAARVEAGRNGPGRLAIAMDYGGALAITALGGGLFWATLQ